MNRIDRYKIERDERWREWIEKIPSIKFPSEWSVKVIPPFSGAMARFIVEFEEKSTSIYLDVHGNLGAMDNPYWEVYPYDDDVYRCDMESTDELIEAIKHSLSTP